MTTEIEMQAPYDTVVQADSKVAEPPVVQCVVLGDAATMW